MMRLLLLLALVTQTGGVLGMPPQRAQRLPLEKKKLVFKSPTVYEKRILRYDSKTREPIYYDPKPQVALLDLKSGKYALRWIGYDGKEKTVIFQRAAAINAIVSASVSRIASGQYIYTYEIRNITSSGEHLSIFAVQNYSSKVSQIKSSNLYVGGITKNATEFKDGNWVGFGLLTPNIVPGETIELKLVSDGQPGLVECRVAGGEQGMKGVGEEMPQELENVLPGYKDWPSGYTVGPIDYLKYLASSERDKYLLERLPLFLKLGWMTSVAFQEYQQSLGRGDIRQVRNRAEQDLKTGKITTEVYEMIHAIQ